MRVRPFGPTAFQEETIKTAANGIKPPRKFFDLKRHHSFYLSFSVTFRYLRAQTAKVVNFEARWQREWLRFLELRF